MADEIEEPDIVGGGAQIGEETLDLRRVAVQPGEIQHRKPWQIRQLAHADDPRSLPGAAP